MYFPAGKLQFLHEKMQILGKNVHILAENLHFLAKNVRVLAKNVRVLAKNMHFLGENLHTLGKNVRVLGENLHILGKNVHFLAQKLEFLFSKLRLCAGNINRGGSPRVSKGASNLAKCALADARASAFLMLLAQNVRFKHFWRKADFFHFPFSVTRYRLSANFPFSAARRAGCRCRRQWLKSAFSASVSSWSDFSKAAEPSAAWRF
jgi:hypothetical protein